MAQPTTPETICGIYWLHPVKLQGIEVHLTPVGLVTQIAHYQQLLKHYSPEHKNYEFIKSLIQRFELHLKLYEDEKEKNS